MESPPIIYKKVPELWFEDGNAILIAEKTAFRVYKGILVTRSEVFKAKFAALGQGSLDNDQGVTLEAKSEDTRDSKESVGEGIDSGTVQDGASDRIMLEGDEVVDVGSLNVIHLIDSESDIENILNEIFGQSTYNPTHWATCGISIDSRAGAHYNIILLTSLLRVSTRYKLTNIRRRTMVLLDMIFFAGYSSEVRSSWECYRSLDGILPLMETAIRSGIIWILPGLFKHTRDEPIEAILEHPEWALINVAIQQIYLAARAKHVKLHPYHIFNIKSPSQLVEHSQKKNACEDAYATLLSKSVQDYPKNGQRNASTLFFRFQDALCDQCKAKDTEQWGLAHKLEAKMLPEILTLGPWDTVLDKRNKFYSDED